MQDSLNWKNGDEFTNHFASGEEVYVQLLDGYYQLFFGQTDGTLKNERRDGILQGNQVLRFATLVPF